MRDFGDDLRSTTGPETGRLPFASGAFGVHPGLDSWGSRPVLGPVILILATLALLAISCDQTPAPVQTGPEKLHVLVPVYAIGDIVRQIGGERVEVSWWIEAGQTLDDLIETPTRRDDLRTADLVITRGKVDPWTLEKTQSVYERRRVMSVDEMYSATTSGPREYIWLDPSVGLELADEITTRLAARDPQHEKVFRANLAKFRADVLGVAEKTRTSLDNAAVRAAFLTLDRGFLPIARRYSLVEARVEKINLADPTPYGVKTLREFAKQAGTVAVFVNDATPGPLLRDWESRLGLMVLPLDPLGSSAPGSGRSTYVQLLQYNFDQVVKGLTAPGSANAKFSAPTTTESDYTKQLER